METQSEMVGMFAWAIPISLPKCESTAVRAEGPKEKVEA